MLLSPPDPIAEALVREGGLVMPTIEETLAMQGMVHWALHGPDGELKDGAFAKNLITQVGDQYYAERAVGIGGAPAQVTGMQLGTGTTAAAKTGAGAAIGTLLANSLVAIAGGFPTSGLNGAARRITWQTVWAAGVATTGSNITEVALVNQSTGTQTVAPAANTISRAVFGTAVPGKTADDTLTVTWTHDLQGA